MFANLVRRQENARNSFLEFAMSLGLDEDEAEAVLAYYLKRRLIRLGANDGQFHAKSGNLLDLSTMREALYLHSSRNQTKRNFREDLANAEEYAKQLEWRNPDNA